MWALLSGFVIAVIISGWSWQYTLYTSVFMLLLTSGMAYLRLITCRYQVALGWVVGMLYVLLRIQIYEAELFAEQWLGKDVELEGYISSIPHLQKPFCHFMLDTVSIAHQSMHRRIRLSWMAPHGCSLPPGTRWRMIARLKPIRGVDTDGTVPQDQLARIAGIHASGYVKASTIPHQIAAASGYYIFLRMQQALWYRYQAICPQCEHGDIIAALLLGLSGEVRDGTRRQFVEAGISHLLAISGLHVGMMAGCSRYMIAPIWRLTGSWMLRVPAPYVAQGGALLLSMLYMLISGSGVPALRAVLMQYGGYGSQHYSMSWSLGSLLLLAAAMTALYWPPLLWSQSFLLSYAAVASIALGFYGRHHCQSWYYRYMHAQCVVTAGLVPITMLLWQQVSVYSLLINMVAIPVFAMVVVPLMMMMVVLNFIPSVAHIIAVTIDIVLSYSLQAVSYVQSLPYSFLYCAPQQMGFYVMVVLMGLIWLLPPGVYARTMAIVLLSLLPSSYMPTAIPLGEMRVTVLDVGQGLAVWLETTHHHVLFDTGPGFAGGYSAGEYIIWPYMRYHGIQAIDTVVVSHPDLDHKGGLQAILSHVPVYKGLTSVAGVFPHAIEHLCHAGDAWEYDGVHFRVVWPVRDLHVSKNNHSCVLQVKARNQTILLTGDIEKKGERLLLQTVTPHNLSSDILIAPHHGSKGASSPAFIAAVAPQQVVFATGAYNRFHFPHTDTWKRYDCGHSRHCYDTAITGSIVLVNHHEIRTNRQRHIAWWSLLPQIL